MGACKTKRHAPKMTDAWLFLFSLFHFFQFFFLLYKTYYAAKNCDWFSMHVGMKVETTNTMMRVDLRDVWV